MTKILKAGRPGRSEMAFGKGRFVDPRSDVQSSRHLVFPVEPDRHALAYQRQAEFRLDATNPLEIVAHMPYNYGNPDSFGPGPQMVQEQPYIPPSIYPIPIYTYGVNRQQ